MSESNIHQASGAKVLQLQSWSNVTDRCTWLLTFLCCAYAIRHAPGDDFTDQHPGESNTQLLFKPPCLARIHPLDTFSIRHCLERLTDHELGTLRKWDDDNSLKLSSLTTLNHISLWVSKNRRPELKKNLVDTIDAALKNLRLDQTLQSEKRAARPYDKKVFVFGKDDRRRIFPPMMRKFPYSNIVRLSTGCTGTLVTPFHVLTAAHCVHTGTGFRNKLEMLKVEVPDTLGVRTYYVEKISIPTRWLRQKSNHEHRSSWDYAVIKLSYAVHDRSQFFPLDVPSSAVLNHNLQFLGFPNSEDSLLMSVCQAKSNKAMVDWNLIVTKCDSAVGNSGAAVLTDDSPRERKKIIGILSSTMPVGRMPYYTPFSIITALTWEKLYDICTEIGDIGVFYQVCPPLEAIPRPSRFHINSNIIPFFG